LTLAEPFRERELETGLIVHLEKFLLELAACRALMVEARIRLCEDRFLTIRRPIVVLWGKKRRKYGPHSRIRRPANQSPTGC
jgi:predicted nuclease of restriction endonuclease-like (RecB) superfamily